MSATFYNSDMNTDFKLIAYIDRKIETVMINIPEGKISEAFDALYISSELKGSNIEIVISRMILNATFLEDIEDFTLIPIDSAIKGELYYDSKKKEIITG